MGKKIKLEEVKALLSAIDDLIEIKLLIRKTAPNYNLDDLLNNQFVSLLKSLQKKLVPMFSKYLKDDISKKEIKKSILKLISANKIALVSANSSKKKLINIGVDPRSLVVSGGPLFLEDYKIINPNISAKTLLGIKKKCERFIDQFKSENWSKKDLIFIYEKENPADKLILNRIEEISNIIGKQVITFEIKSWKNLDN